ncbi:MAG TPA: lysophospholipid acyltransferase family protein [Cyclobacteriaceae bacterium]|nr:lysophospholipid acyltransferase family protein [Cyclobacteriaceae bacterium]
MKAVIFYLIHPIVMLVASLPFPALYAVSDVMSLVFRAVGYRRKVILTNLRASFPEKSEAEIRSISRAYYRHMCDVIVESLKAMKMDEAETRKHAVAQQHEWLNQLYNENRSIILVAGHYGNWEWASSCFMLNTPYDLSVIYRPLSNTYFDKLVARMRQRFGIKIIAEGRTLREMAAARNSVTATAFVADQSAPRDHAYWTTFLNQDTSIYTGPEKLAKKFNFPIVFVNMHKIRRGYYEMAIELLCENPAETEEGAISEAFARRLEKDIIASPATWLWSHKRWKHKRPDDKQQRVSTPAA